MTRKLQTIYHKGLIEISLDKFNWFWSHIWLWKCWSSKHPVNNGNVYRVFFLWFLPIIIETCHNQKRYLTFPFHYHVYSQSTRACTKNNWPICPPRCSYFIYFLKKAYRILWSKLSIFLSRICISLGVKIRASVILYQHLPGAQKRDLSRSTDQIWVSCHTDHWCGYYTLQLDRQQILLTRLFKVILAHCYAIIWQKYLELMHSGLFFL